MEEESKNILISDVTETFARCIEILKKKNNDYAGEKTLDPFKNFKSSEVVGVDPAKAILVRMCDKMARVGNLLNQEAAVKDESISDTLIDLCNYSAILLSYIKNNKKQ